jgi:hypothetical protein
MKSILMCVTLLAAFSFSYVHVKMHNLLRQTVVEQWIENTVIRIPSALKAEAYRRAFDSSYELYDPVNWYDNL